MSCWAVGQLRATGAGASPVESRPQPYVILTAYKPPLDQESDKPQASCPGDPTESQRQVAVRVTRCATHKTGTHKDFEFEELSVDGLECDGGVLAFTVCSESAIPGSVDLLGQAVIALEKTLSLLKKKKNNSRLLSLFSFFTSLDKKMRTH